MSSSIILASASQSRRQLLTNADVDFTAITSNVDEDIIKQTFLKEGNLIDLAVILAQAKAMDISTKNPAEFVVGADQTLIFDNKIYDKPRSREEARDHLLALRGKTHQLETAIAVAQNGNILWSYSESSYLTMRDFSPKFLGQYLSAEKDQITTTVGGYKLEGLGLQLFEKIDGDFFSILGLPMLKLLKFLREKNALEK